MCMIGELRVALFWVIRYNSLSTDIILRTGMLLGLFG